MTGFLIAAAIAWVIPSLLFLTFCAIRETIRRHRKPTGPTCDVCREQRCGTFQSAVYHCRLCIHCHDELVAYESEVSA